MSVFNAGLPNNQPTAFPSTKLIVNDVSGGGASTSGQVGLTGKQIVSGALVAGVLQNMLTINGKAEVSVLGLSTNDATSRTMQLQIIVDGVIVFNPISNAVVVSGAGLGVAGSAAGTSRSYGNVIRCNSSLQVNVASSLSETGKFTLTYALQQF